MLRIARIVIPGVPHHITQRGNNKQDVFFVDEYRIAFLRLLKEQSQKFGMRIVWILPDDKSTFPALRVLIISSRPCAI